MSFRYRHSFAVLTGEGKENLYLYLYLYLD